MSVIELERQKVLEVGPPQVSHLAEVAETIRDDALALARERVSVFCRQDDLPALLRQPDYLSAFLHGIATRAAVTLAAHDARVQAVYTFDPSANPDAEAGNWPAADTSVHLLVRVSTPSAALEAFVASLDRALAESLRELPAPAFTKRETVLDVFLITERDVRLGLGSAGLLSSIFAPPLKIWQREK